MHKNSTANALLDGNGKMSGASVLNRLQSNNQSQQPSVVRRRSQSFSNLSDIKTIDDEDDDEEENETEKDPMLNMNHNFDEKDEICVDTLPVKTYSIPNEKENLESASVDLGEEDLKQSWDKRNFNRSTFYNVKDDMIWDKQEAVDDNSWQRLYNDEVFVMKIEKVGCIYSSSVLKSTINDDLKYLTTDCITIHGKLVLTNFQIIFMAFDEDLKRLAEFNEQLYLFNCKNNCSFSIPLASIYEIRACK